MAACIGGLEAGNGRYLLTGVDVGRHGSDHRGVVVAHSGLSRLSAATLPHQEDGAKYDGHQGQEATDGNQNAQDATAALLSGRRARRRTAAPIENSRQCIQARR